MILAVLKKNDECRYHKKITSLKKTVKQDKMCHSFCSTISNARKKKSNFSSFIDKFFCNENVSSVSFTISNNIQKKQKQNFNNFLKKFGQWNCGFCLVPSFKITSEKI